MNSQRSFACSVGNINASINIQQLGSRSYLILVLETQNFNYSNKFQFLKSKNIFYQFAQLRLELTQLRASTPFPVDTILIHRLYYQHDLMHLLVFTRSLNRFHKTVLCCTFSSVRKRRVKFLVPLPGNGQVLISVLRTICRLGILFKKKKLL